MPAEEDWIDDDFAQSPYSYPAAPLPAHERTWRHPSELGSINVAEEVRTHAPSRMLLVATGVCGLAFALVLGRVLVGGTSLAPDVAADTIAPRRAPLRSAVATAPSATATSPSIDRTFRGSTVTSKAAVDSVTTRRVPDLSPITAAASSTTEPAPTERTVAFEPAAPSAGVTAITVLRPIVSPLSPSGGTRWALVWEDRFHAVTTAQGAEPGDSLLLRLPDGESTEGTVIRLDPDAGLAIVELSVGATSTGNGVRVGDHRLAVTTVDRSILPALDVAAPNEKIVAMTGNGEGAIVAMNDDGTLSIKDSSRNSADLDVAEAAPLVDGDGKVVGLCTWRRGNPHVVALQSANGLVRQSIGWFGVRLGIDPGTGAVRAETVVDGSPADLAGLQPFDIIRTVDGTPITSVDQLIEMIRRLDPGHAATVEFTGHQGLAADDGEPGEQLPPGTSVADHGSVDGPAGADYSDDDLVTALVTLGSLADAPGESPSQG